MLNNFFIFNITPTTQTYTLSLHDALPISGLCQARKNGMSLSAGAERRSGSERRRGGDRRLWLGTATERAARDREPVPLGRLLPHARFNETEAAQRTAAITAHQGELSARLGRNVGLSVAALA